MLSMIDNYFQWLKELKLPIIQKFKLPFIQKVFVIQKRRTRKY